MDKVSGQVLNISGWALEKADSGASCLRCGGGIKNVKITFRASNGIINLGPWGAHFCLNCLILFANDGFPPKLLRLHAM